MTQLPDCDEAAFRDLVRRIEPEGTVSRAWRQARRHLGRGDPDRERSGGELSRLLLRRHGVADRTRNRQVARDEFPLLRIALANGLAVPRPHLLDESSTNVPTLGLIIEYVEGGAEFSPDNLSGYLKQAAGVLAQIH